MPALPTPIWKTFNPAQVRDEVGKFASGGFATNQYGRAVEYHSNPSHRQILRLLKDSSSGALRGLADDKDVIVWDGSGFLHQQMEDHLGTKGDHFLMTKRGDDFEVEGAGKAEWLKAHPFTKEGVEGKGGIGARRLVKIKKALPTSIRKSFDPAKHPRGDRIGLIADILGGVFGAKAIPLFGKDKGEKGLAIYKGWQTADHPRGKDGKFIPKNSPEAVSAAKTAIQRTLTGRKNSETHQSLVEHLAILSVPQLHALKKEYGLSASADDKSKLIEKLAARLNTGRRIDQTALAVIPPKSGPLAIIGPDASRPEETGFSGLANNGVYFIEGVAQKRGDKPDTIIEKEHADAVPAPGPDAGVPSGVGENGPRSQDRTPEGTDRGSEDGTGSGDFGRKSDVGAIDGASDGGIAPPEERIVTARAEFTKPADPSLVPEVLQQHLRPHQIQGVAAAVASLDKNGGFLLADGTGVGKSREQLATAKIYADRGNKVLIVTRAQVIAPNWKTGEITGSFKNDSEAMDIGLNLVRKDDEIKAGQVSVTTYQNLAEMKKQVDGNTIILWDESHSLKNYDSAQAKHGAEMNKAAKAVMFNSATPADKPLHIASMARAKVFGSGKWEDTYRELGMRQKEIYVPNLGRSIKKWEIDPKVGAAECARRLDGLFDKMTSEGLMLKREISMKGVAVQFDRLELPKECHDAMAQIETDMAKSSQPPGLRRAATLMHQRRQQEPYKIPATIASLKSELAEGRQVVIFCSRVNESEATGKTHSGLSEEGEQLTSVKSEGTAKLLAEALRSEGITDFVDLHGGASKKARDKGMLDFQSGKSRVAIATIEAAGTGVNLDDTVGDKPRTTLVMTAPFSAVDNMQAAGRTWRLNTKSAPRLRYLFGDTEVDRWNAGLIAGKMKTLGAVAGGEVHALDIPLDLTEEGAADYYEETGGKSGEKQPKFAWPRELARASGSTSEVPSGDKTWSVPADKVDAIRHLTGLNFSDKQPKSAPVSAPIRPIQAPQTAPVPSPKSSASFHVSGNTFEHKDAIRQAGGRWNADRKVWVIPSSSKAKLERLRGLSFTAKKLKLASLPGLRLDPVQKSLRPFRKRPDGSTWKGPSGHWFMMKNGRCVPAPGPRGKPPIEVPVVAEGISGEAAQHVVQSVAQAIGSTKAKLGSAAKWAGEKAYASLPAPAQHAFDRIHSVGMAVEHHLEGFYHAQQGLVKRLAKTYGLSAKTTARLATSLAAADALARWTGNVPIVEHGVHAVAHIGGFAGLALAKVGFYIPVASLAFVATATAGLPALGMIVAARRAIGAIRGVRKGLEPAFAGRLAAAYRRHDSDQFHAAFCAALDETGDANKALRMAEKHKSLPDFTTDEIGRLALEFLERNQWDYLDRLSGVAKSFDESKHPRASDGEFTTNPGLHARRDRTTKTGKVLPNFERSHPAFETDDDDLSRHNEADNLEGSQEERENIIADAREAEDDKINAARESDDEKLEADRDKEDAGLKAARKKEDKANKVALSKESKTESKRRSAEDDAIEDARNAEDVACDTKRSAEDEAFEKAKIQALGPIADAYSRASTSADRTRLREDLTLGESEWGVKEQDVFNARDAEDANIIDAREMEDAKRDAAREEWDDNLNAREEELASDRETEDEEIVERRGQRDADIQNLRDEEDDKMSEERDVEDKNRQETFWAEDRSLLTKWGHKSAPGEMAKRLTLTDLREAAKQADPNPTEAQRRAGNHAMGHVTWRGLPITIERAKGTVRSGTDRNGKSWSVKMTANYGFIKRTRSEADGDHIDVYLADADPHGSDVVFVVNQLKPDGSFDEAKCMLGYSSAEAAKAAYLAHYSKGWRGFGSIVPMTLDQFKVWIRDGDSAKPVTPDTVRVAGRDDCPVCGERFNMQCRCMIGNKSCPNGHQWHRCPVHRTINMGDGHSSGFGCTCPRKALRTPIRKGLSVSVPKPKRPRKSLLSAISVRLGLIADIVGGIFKSVDKKWTAEESAHHPRGPGGRFIPRGSAEAVSAAKTSIKDALGGKTSADSLADHLSLLTVAQLHDLKKEYGLRASGKTRADLIAKLSDRLKRGRVDISAKPSTIVDTPAKEPGGKTEGGKMESATAITEAHRESAWSVVSDAFDRLGGNLDAYLVSNKEGRKKIARLVEISGAPEQAIRDEIEKVTGRKILTPEAHQAAEASAARSDRRMAEQAAAIAAEAARKEAAEKAEIAYRERETAAKQEKERRATLTPHEKAKEKVENPEAWGIEKKGSSDQSVFRLM